MIKMIRSLSILSVILFMGTGCGTIMGKRYSTIRIDAMPAADYLVVNSRNEKMTEGHTPGRIKLKVTDSEKNIPTKYYVIFTAPRQATQVVVVNAAVNNWSKYGNAMNGLLGSYIDMDTGARFRLENVCVQMTPAQFTNQVRPDLISR